MLASLVRGGSRLLGEFVVSLVSFCGGCRRHVRGLLAFLLAGSHRSVLSAPDPCAATAPPPRPPPFSHPFSSSAGARAQSTVARKAAAGRVSQVRRFSARDNARAPRPRLRRRSPSPPPPTVHSLAGYWRCRRRRVRQCRGACALVCERITHALKAASIPFAPPPPRRCHRPPFLHALSTVPTGCA